MQAQSLQMYTAQGFVEAMHDQAFPCDKDILFFFLASCSSVRASGLRLDICLAGGGTAHPNV